MVAQLNPSCYHVVVQSLTVDRATAIRRTCALRDRLLLERSIAEAHGWGDTANRLDAEAFRLAIALTAVGVDPERGMVAA